MHPIPEEFGIAGPEDISKSKSYFDFEILEDDLNQDAAAKKDQGADHFANFKESKYAADNINVKRSRVEIEREKSLGL